MRYVLCPLASVTVMSVILFFGWLSGTELEWFITRSPMMAGFWAFSTAFGLIGGWMTGLGVSIWRLRRKISEPIYFRPVTRP